MFGHVFCWMLHRREREVLVPGVLPYDIDAVVFCYRCDRCRGRGVEVLGRQAQAAGA